MGPAHHRVKIALARKEEAVNSLRKQHEVGPSVVLGWSSLGWGHPGPDWNVSQAAVKRADHLEELLEQHRRPSLNAK